MQRVGEMLGIEIKTDQVVSVTTEETKEESPVQPEINQEENPLFNNNVEPTNNASPETNEENFWFPSDTPDALNELPDLPKDENTNNNNFFTDNIPDLNFPNLNLGFSPNDTEEK